MTPLLPIYALTVYDSDDVTPLFSVTTNPAGTNPYLKAFDNFPEQEVDFARGATSIGQMNVRIVDVPTDPTDQTTGWLTARLAEAGGYSELNGHRVLATQDLGAGAEVVLEGVVKGVTLLDTYSTYELELRDIRERERKLRVFERTDTPTILPRGVLDGYGIHTTIPFFGIDLWVPIAPTQPVKGQYQSLGSGQGEITFGGIPQSFAEFVLTPAMREALLSVAPIDGSPEVLVYDRWKLLWRETGSGDPWIVITRVASAHPSLVRNLPLFTESSLGLDTLYINNVVDGGTLPGNLDEIDVIIQYDGPVTKDWHLHLQNMTVGELLAEVYDGDHSVNPTRLRYESAAVLALNTPIRARIAAPVDDFRDWSEKHAYPIAHAAPTLNADGEIAPVTYLLPDAAAVLPHLDDTNCAPDGAGWSHASQDAVNLITTKYVREYRLRDKDSPGLAESDRIKEYEQPVTVHDQASIDLLGEKKLDISGLLLRAIGTGDGGPLFGDYIDETGALVAARVGYALRDRLSRGGQYFRVKALRTDADVEALKGGSWVTCGFSWMPDYNSGERGLSRLAQVVTRRNTSAAWCVLTLIDAGSNNAPLAAPTLGALSVDAAGVVSIPVTALGAGSEARVDFAVNATEPAATSELWTFLGRVDSVPTTLKTPPVPPGVVVWARARGEGIGRRPSTYTVASSVAVGDTARVTNVSVTLDEFGTPTVSWLPNTVCLGVQINYDVHEVGTAPGAGTDVDLDASDLSYEIPETVPAGFAVSVTVTPYPGWTGSAVSGTAGPPVGVRVVGTAVFRTPVVAMTVAQSGSTGSLDLTVEDPDLVLTSVVFAKKIDSGAYGALQGGADWDRSTGTVGTDGTIVRGEDITLTAKHSVSIRYVVNFDRGLGAETIEGAHSFDSNLVAEITAAEISFDANGEVVVSVQGDEDCADIFVTVGDGSAPADPTDSVNDGTVAARNGTISTGVKITTGNDAFVKVVGYDANGVAGPVRTFQQARRIGPFHKDTSVRDVGVTTSEVTLETITIPAGKLGTDGALHLVASGNVSGVSSMTVRVRLNGNLVKGVVLSADANWRIDMLLYNDGATNAQQTDGVFLANAYVDPFRSTHGEDSTAAMDITITGQLADSGEFINLLASLAEFVGTN